MAYERQLQTAMDRLDQSLARLHGFIKRGEQKSALQYMEEGELKERYEELQNIVTISQTGNMGARGTKRIGNI